MRRDGIAVHDAELGRRLARHGHRAQRDLRPALDVLLEQLPVVHVVELVAAEDDEILRRMLQEIPHVLAHGVGGALVPVDVVLGLLRGEDFHERARLRKVVELVARADVLVQARRVELREQVHLAQAAVEAVGNGDVHEPVLAAEGHGGFGAFLGQGNSRVPAPPPMMMARLRCARSSRCRACVMAGKRNFTDSLQPLATFVTVEPVPPRNVATTFPDPTTA